MDWAVLARVFLSCEIRERGDSVRHVEVTCWGPNVDALGFRVGYPYVDRQINSTFIYFSYFGMN